jgi:hypothetical protein
MRANQVKTNSDKVKPSALIASMLALSLHLCGCSPSTELAETNRKLMQANEKIASLEAQLAQAKTATPAPVPTAPPALSTPPTQEPDASVPANTIGQQWHYDASEDQMTSGKRKIAWVSSTNSVSFGFPYNGEQQAQLTLRTDPRFGKSVIFGLEKGQILCSAFDSCTVQVRFDDEKPTKYAASGPSDQSTTVIFIEDYGRFLAKLRKAKRVRISTNIYQQGSPVFEFDVSGFDNDRYQSKS